jgi:hypothetical protein
VLGVSWKRVLVAAGPAVAAAAGVAAGAGVVRVLLPGLSIGPLVLGAIAGAAGGTLFLRVLAPGTIGDLVEQARRMRGGGDETPDGREDEQKVAAPSV